jgi:hypothetical protein
MVLSVAWFVMAASQLPLRRWFQCRVVHGFFLVEFIQRTIGILGPPLATTGIKQERVLPGLAATGDDGDDTHSLLINHCSMALA